MNIISRHLKNRKWRKNPQVGDWCYYKGRNFEYKIDCKIRKVDGSMVLITAYFGPHSMTGWEDVNLRLKIV